MRSRIGRPASNASLKSVVAVWQTPPPIDGQDERADDLGAFEEAALGGARADDAVEREDLARLDHGAVDEVGHQVDVVDPVRRRHAPSASCTRRASCGSRAPSPWRSSGPARSGRATARRRHLPRPRPRRRSRPGTARGRVPACDGATRTVFPLTTKRALWARTIHLPRRGRRILTSPEPVERDVETLGGGRDPHRPRDLARRQEAAVGAVVVDRAPAQRPALWPGRGGPGVGGGDQRRDDGERRPHDRVVLLEQAQQPVGLEAKADVARRRQDLRPLEPHGRRHRVAVRAGERGEHVPRAAGPAERRLDVDALRRDERERRPGRERARGRRLRRRPRPASRAARGTSAPRR